MKNSFAERASSGTEAEGPVTRAGRLAASMSFRGIRLPARGAGDSNTRRSGKETGRGDRAKGRAWALRRRPAPFGGRRRAVPEPPLRNQSPIRGRGRRFRLRGDDPSPGSSHNPETARCEMVARRGMRAESPGSARGRFHGIAGRGRMPLSDDTYCSRLD